MKKLILLLMILSGLYACKEHKSQKKTQKPTEINFTKEGELQIIDTAGVRKAEFDIELATDDYEQQTGLMYRTKMADNQGMLFIFDEEKPHYFYMKNTYIPLDIIFVAADSTIVHIAKNAEPLNEEVLPSEKPAQFVLEIKAGLSDAHQIKKGDKLVWKKL